MDDETRIAWEKAVLNAQNLGAITDWLKGAIQDNKDFIAVDSPTTAQVATHLKKVSRQNVRIIRILTNMLDSIE